MLGHFVLQVAALKKAAAPDADAGAVLQQLNSNTDVISALSGAVQQQHMQQTQAMMQQSETLHKQVARNK